MSRSNRSIVPGGSIYESSNTNTVWNPMLKGVGPTSHSHDHHLDESQELKSPILRALSKIATKIKSVDGIDETANLAGQILPGIAAPIATSIILVVAIPFVWLGVLGMKEEHEEATKELERIIGRSSNVGDNFKDLVEFTVKYQDLLRSKFNIDMDGLDSAPGFEIGMVRDENYMKFVENIVDHLSINNKRIIAELSNRYGWTGVIGMSGMFLGMLPASASAVLETINTIQASAVLESTSTILQLTAGACFIPGQAFMGIYAYNRKKQGLIAQDVFLKIKDTFKESSKDLLRDDLRDNVEQVIDKLIDYNKKHSIEYGDLTMVGQAFMIAGTACSMSGVGILASGPLFGVGAPLTIYGAIHRIYYSAKEDGFKGEKEDLDFLSEYVEDILGNINPLTICVNNIDDDAGKFSQLGDCLNGVTDKLAESKLCSLLFHLLNDRKYKNKDNKIDLLDELFVNESSGSHDMKIKNSHIEDMVVKKVRGIICSDRDAIVSLLEEGNEGLKLRIGEKFMVDSDKINSMDNGEVKTLLQDTKKTLKFLRFSVIDSVVKVSHMVAADRILFSEQGISQEQVELTFPKKSVKPSECIEMIAGNERISRV